MKKPHFLLLILISISYIGKANNDDFSSYRVKSFVFHGCNATVVFPDKTDLNHNWVMRSGNWGECHNVDVSLVDSGFHLVYLDCDHLYGNIEAVELWNKFYTYCTNAYSLNRKVVLEGVVAGNLLVYNWASNNLDKVICVYSESAVCDIKSWPGGLFSGSCDTLKWYDCLQACQLDSLSVFDYKQIPLYTSQLLAQVRIPIFLVYSRNDDVVPPDENCIPLAEEYNKLGGNATMIMKFGQNHLPLGLEDADPVIQFIVSHATD